jgi:hypothetical protein
MPSRMLQYLFSQSMSQVTFSLQGQQVDLKQKKATFTGGYLKQT